MGELPVGLPHSSCEGSWLYISVVVAQKFSGSNFVWESKEEQKKNILQKNILEDPCVSQEIFSGSVESRRVFAITQHLKGSLTAICAILKS